MTMLPTPIKDRSPINRRLGIKSSIDNPKSLIASIFLLWIGCEKKDDLDYSDPSSDGENKLKINPVLAEKIKENVEKSGFVLPHNYIDILESSPIFETQIEPLQVAIQLVWKLGTIKFCDNNIPSTKERTGKSRFNKKISFSIAMDIFDQIIKDENGEYKYSYIDLFWSWIENKEYPNKDQENKIIKTLTILSESTQMKIKNENLDLIFQQYGIYDALLKTETQEGVELPGEKQGPLRIIYKSINERMNPYIDIKDRKIVIKENKKSELKEYKQRVDTFLEITESNINYIKDNIFEEENNTTHETTTTNENTIEAPHNLIVYGAPGTGKSYFLNDYSKKIGFNNIRRVIFYPDYTYSQFVGGYRPSHIYDPTNGEKIYKKTDTDDVRRPGEPIIEYQFTPGPFISILIDSLKNPNKKYLLLIEELNRADAPSVFGDIFQLLDRDETGSSNYPISLSDETHSYLKLNGINDEKIKLPSNLYIWATMNNADQGVIPLDTAFKRRWNFHYITLNEKENIVDNLEIKSKFKNDNGETINLNWNKLRKKINDELSSLGIHEDLLIGPFFLKESEFKDDKAFQYKLLSYLKDDILRHQSDRFFSCEGKTLSDLLEAYNQGKNIFNFSLSD